MTSFLCSFPSSKEAETPPVCNLDIGPRLGTNTQCLFLMECAAAEVRSLKYG